MTKRLLAIALVVMVAISAMYLPSVLSVSAAETTKLANKQAYDLTVASYTVTIDGNTVQIANFSDADIANETKLKAAVEREMPTYKDQVATAVVRDKAVTVTTAKQVEVKVTTPTNAKPNGGVELAKKKVLVGSSVAEFIAGLPSAPVVYNKMFTNWSIADIDGNYDGKIDDGTTLTLTANYVSMGEAGPYVSNFSVASSGDTVDAVTKGTYTDGAPTTKRSYTNTWNIVIQTADTDAADATNAIVNVPDLTIGGKDYTFSYWLITNTSGVPNSKEYKAIYKEKVTTRYNYKYTFAPKDVVNFGEEIVLETNTLTNNPFGLLTDAKKKIITDYFADKGKSLRYWAIDTTGGNTNIRVTAVMEDVSPYIYYYINENGNVDKAIANYASDVAALNNPAPATKGHVFVRWEKVANENTFNGFYNVGEEIVYPVAKNGNDSFAFSSTATPKTATYKKTMVARVTAGKGTFSKEEVKLVNKSVKLSAQPVNCTVKKGTMKDTSGTPFTITFNKKGTAYVIVSIAYNGEVYTKTLTKTVK